MESAYNIEFKDIPDPEKALDESEYEKQLRYEELEHIYKTAGTVSMSPTLEPALAEDIEEYED